VELAGFVRNLAFGMKLAYTLLPIMKQGGYVLGIDHQTPPSVSLQEYEFYLKLLREYAIAAMM